MSGPAAADAVVLDQRHVPAVVAVAFHRHGLGAFEVGAKAGTLAELFERTCSDIIVRLAAVIAVYPKRSMSHPQIALNRTWVSSLLVEMTWVLAGYAGLPSGLPAAA